MKHILEDIHWGDFTSGLNALFSLAAFVSAAIAAKYAKGILENDSSRRQTEIFESKVAQARLISAWPTLVVDQLQGNPSFQNYAFAGVAAHIRNASHQPVYSISVEFFYNGKSVYKSFMNILPPETTEEELFPSDILNTLTEDQIDFETPMATWDAKKASRSAASKFSVEYGFIDVNQQKWFRRRTGELSVHSI